MSYRGQLILRIENEPPMHHLNRNQREAPEKYVDPLEIVDEVFEVPTSFSANFQDFQNQNDERHDTHNWDEDGVKRGQLLTRRGLLVVLF